jgi:glycosyltransferase involved in cell wall biosynthesis
MPLLSICIPTHNMGRYIRGAIQSALQQDCTDLELIICDDGSTDDTGAIVRGFSDPRLRYLAFENRAGQAGNFNRCLCAASGDYLTLLHADDLLLPGFVSDRLGRLQADRELAFVFGAVRVIDADDRHIATSAPWSSDRRFSSREMVQELLRACVVSPPSLMVRRRNVESAGRFREDLTWGHDWDWTIRLATTGSAAYTAEPAAAYRVHDASGTADMLKAAKNGVQERQILSDALRSLEAGDASFARLRREAFARLGRRQIYYAHLALERGQPAVARDNLRWAASADRRLTVRPTFWLLLLASLGFRSPYSMWARFRGMTEKPEDPGRSPAS